MWKNHKTKYYFEKSKNLKLINIDIKCKPNCLNIKNSFYCKHISSINASYLHCFLFPNCKIFLLDASKEPRKKITEKVCFIKMPEKCKFLKSQNRFKFYENNV